MWIRCVWCLIGSGFSRSRRRWAWEENKGARPRDAHSWCATKVINLSVADLEPVLQRQLQCWGCPLGASFPWSQPVNPRMPNIPSNFRRTKYSVSSFQTPNLVTHFSHLQQIKLYNFLVVSFKLATSLCKLNNATYAIKYVNYFYYCRPISLQIKFENAFNNLLVASFF